jgi:CheY-like chemotaxis protein
MGGIQAIERIRQEDFARHLPVVLLIAAGRPWDRTAGLELGISGLVTKPVCSKEFLDVVMSAICPADAPRQPETPCRAATAHGIKPLRILVAEDNPVNRRLVALLLQKHGHSVVLAENGRQAVEAFERQTFDVILTDVQMPEMDGCQAAAAVRARERELHVRPTPIVALTAHAMKGDREKCLAAGMNDYLPKPISSVELQHALEKFSRKCEDEVAATRP